MRSVNHLLVSVDSTFDDVMFTYKDDKGVERKFYKSVVQNMEWDVTVTGVAVSDMPDMGIGVGDEVIFSYLVISQKDYTDSAAMLRKILDVPGVVMEWRNDEGLMVKKVKGPFPGMWDAMAMTLKGDLLGTCHGKESEVDRFLGQFDYSVQKGRFRHLFEVDGKDLWRVERDLILGVRRKGSETIELFRDHVLVKPLYLDMTTVVSLEEGIRLPEHYVQAEYESMGVVVGDVAALGLKSGDFVVFEKRFVQKYRFWGKDYFVVAPNRVFGVFDGEKPSNLVTKH